MTFNVCQTCLASDGRAGLLIGIKGLPDECSNCHETRKTGNIVIHTNLKRTDDEIQRTIKILVNHDRIKDSKIKRIS